MKYTVHIRHDAELDFEEAAFRYEKQRDGLCDEFLNEIDLSGVGKGCAWPLFPVLFQINKALNDQITHNI